MQPSSIVNRPFVHALLAPLFLLLVSNFEALLEVLHRLGLFWAKDRDRSIHQFLLDMAGYEGIIQRAHVAISIGCLIVILWWWRASRVIQDYDMIGNHLEVIDEFPILFLPARRLASACAGDSL